jgi:serine/threonine-protein kinase
MTAQTFLSQLRKSQLLSPEKMEQIVRTVAGAGDATDFSDRLVGAGLLTSYQVKQLAQGEGKGLRLGQYQILDELGRGGFGCVYKARHTLMDRLVALKVIAPERIEDSRARDWFLREVRATTRLNHPNIVLAYDAAEVDGQLFLAMEYIDGPTLQQLVQRQGPLPLGLAWHMLQQAVQALRYAHEQHLVHRDIKPANLLIPQQHLAGRSDDEARPALVKIVDFGLARLQSQNAGASLGLGRDGFLGTPDYVSPEQARNMSQVDIRSDLYSLGCTFYYALTGRKPFQGSGPLEVILQHLEKPPTRLEHLRPEVPAALAGVLRRMMEKKPDSRFQTPEALLNELSFLCPTSTAAGGRLSGILSAPTALPLSPKYLGDLATLAPPSLSGEQRDQTDADAIDALPATVYLPGSALMAQTRTTVDEKGPRQDQEAMPSMPQPVQPLADQSRGQDTLRGEDTHDDVRLTPATPPRRVESDLQRAWERWLDVVAQLDRGERCLLSPAAYKTLHADLLGCLREQASCGAVERRGPYERLAALLEPWLSLTTLAGIDAATLRDLHMRCRQLGQAAGLRSSGRSAWGVALLLALLLFLVPVAVTLYQARGFPQLPRQLSSRDLWRFAEANPMLSLAFVLPGVVLVGFSLLSRLTRR